MNDTPPPKPKPPIPRLFPGRVLSGFLIALLLLVLYLRVFHEQTETGWLDTAGANLATYAATILCSISLWCWFVFGSTYPGKYRLGVLLVGLLTLICIVKKNAIMMIDFALDAQRTGHRTPADAIFAACLVRFRPIMMTTFAAMMGALPIALAYGQGGEARQPLGLVVVGGLIVSQLVTLYLTPILYLYLDRLQTRLSRQRPSGLPLATAPARAT